MRGIKFAPQRAASSTPCSAAWHVARIAPSAQGPQALHLLRLECFVNPLDGNRPLCFQFEAVHADHNGFSAIDRLLILVGGVLDLLLHESALDGLQHPT